MERINKILGAENTILEIEHPKHVEGLHQGIELRHVYFSYNSSREILHDINLTVEKGRTIALVGQSGSGKSTLVDLIPRYHDIQQGLGALKYFILKVDARKNMLFNPEESINFNGDTGPFIQSSV